MSWSRQAKQAWKLDSSSERSRLNEGRQWFFASPWLIVAPSAALAGTAIAVGIRADRLVDRLDGNPPAESPR